MTRVLSYGGAQKAKGARVRITGLGTATPYHLPQSVSATYTEELCCDTPEQRQFLHRMYEHSGVSSRGCVLASRDDPELKAIREFYRPRRSPDDRGPTTQQRMRLYAQYAPPLAERAARSAIASAALSPLDITHLIPVTCTGFVAPGLDYQLISRLGLSPNVQRAQLGFMGCHGGFNALGIAHQIVKASPDARVLVCCVELCSLHLSYGSDPQRIVANALFADGAAAAVVTGDSSDCDCAHSGDGAFDIELVSLASALLPDSADAMTWQVGDHGFEMTLSPKVPQLVKTHLAGWVNEWLGQCDTSLDEITSLAVHPGGPKVLSAVAESLHRPESDLAASRHILREHGNMSSATILFVLDELARAGASGQCLALGFGPGLMAEGMLLGSV